MINRFKKRILPVLLLIFLILLAYLPFYKNGGFLGDLGDPVGQTIPNKFLLVEYIKKEIVPLWNPFSFLGFPFLADIQVGTFYLPDILIFSVFSPLKAHNVSVLVHIIFAGIGVYLFSKKVSKSEIVSFALSLMMSLSGTFLSRIVYLNFLETIAYIPWVLLIIRNKNPSIPLLSLLFVLMIVAGHPVAFFYSLIIIFTFFLMNHFHKWKNVITALFLGVLISAIQIIPFMFLKNASVRDALSYSGFTEGSLNPGSVSRFVNPFNSFANVNFDYYIHFGTVAFLCFIASVFFIKRFNKKLKKLYLTGVVLFLLGVLFGLGGNFPMLAKLLYEIPVFNIIRVPARYIILSHFGALLSLIVFFAFLVKKRKCLALGLLTLIAINSLFIPYITLNRYEISEAENNYLPEIKTLIESRSNDNFSLSSVPSYFLSSSYFVFPNRHVLNHMPNVIGYNPLILRRYYEFLPIAPVGAFENPNYFMDYYEKFELIGLKYYIFPTIDFLKDRNLNDKKNVIDFLNNKGWQKLKTDNNEFEIWANPSAKPFVYFENKDNKIDSITFKPGSIKINTDVVADDNLIVNQVFTSGWIMYSDIDDEKQSPALFNDLLQAYNVKKGTGEIEIVFKPKELYYGAILSLIGISLFLFIFIRNRYVQKN